MKRPPYKQAFITGGSSGIGYAIAGYLVQRGTAVTIASRDRDKLLGAQQKLKEKAADGKSVEILQLDISDRPAVEGKLRELVSAGNTPDLLVNCAGMAYPDYFESFDSAVFDRTLSVNLTGTWNVLRTIVPHMQAGSQVVNVASVSGLVGTFGYTAYSASKFGIIGLSEVLRNELSLRGIRVSVLCPPDTDTPQLEQENLTKPYETRVISGNAGILKPEQVAEALFSGLRRKRFLIIPGFMAKLTCVLKRLFPGLVYFIIDSDAKKAYRRKNDERNRTEC